MIGEVHQEVALVPPICQVVANTFISIITALDQGFALCRDQERRNIAAKGAVLLLEYFLRPHLDALWGNNPREADRPQCIYFERDGDSCMIAFEPSQKFHVVQVQTEELRNQCAGMPCLFYLPAYQAVAYRVDDIVGGVRDEADMIDE